MTIYFVPHPTTGRMHPVSVAHADALVPTSTTPGLGISHFGDCKRADDFRSKSKR